ncbi:hypothetical protein FNF28_04546 [Cafeteria roenbergensis]|uniref:Enoyl-CoA hydratase n=1 Tax=Cafeteria roenbergensis TaxID=33653 RepID=A0A5A8DCV5_CAFRO|nr:hypothetical protein FNF28_04546 [Cafeteria roenbergensis]
MSVRIAEVQLGPHADSAAIAMVVCWSAPAKLNALSPAMLRRATGAIEQANADPRVVAVVFCGDPASRVMSSGADLDAAAAEEADGASPVLDFMLAVMRCKPLVCVAIHAAAVGMNVTLLPHADLVVADSGAWLATPFGSLGICPEFAASKALPAMIGHQRALRLMLWGTRLPADEAAALGLVTELVQEGAPLSPLCPEGLATAALGRVLERLQALAATVPRAAETARLFRKMLRDATEDKAAAERLAEQELRVLRARVDEGVPMEGIALRASRL